MLVVKNFGEFTNRQLTKSTLANGHDNLLASKTMANQTNHLISLWVVEDEQLLII